MFRDRQDAGERLARALYKYKDKDALVLAIPKGGVEVAYQVAKTINAGLSIIIARKLPFPDNAEAGFGAIAEDGSTFIFKDAGTWLSREAIDRIIKEQKQEIERRIEILRKGKQLPEVKDRIIILVDDGIAMGSTMRACIMLCRNRKAKKIVVAAPVSGIDVADEMRELVDELIVLEQPPFFRAVAQVYRNWYDVSDKEVKETMERWENAKHILKKDRQ